MEEAAQDRPALAQLRCRSQSFMGYLLWVLVAMVILWAANTCAQLAGHWIAFLRGVRGAAGLAPPTHGPDYWVIGGMVLLVTAVIIVVAACYFAYRAAWNRRLAAVWGVSSRPEPRKLGPQRQLLYLDRLAASPGWIGAGLARQSDSREGYCELAAAMLKGVGADIAARAVTTGFIVGMNRNPLLDTHHRRIRF